MTDDASPADPLTALAGDGFPVALSAPITADQAAAMIPDAPARLVGEPGRRIASVAALDACTEDSIAFCNRTGAKSTGLIAGCRARVLVIGRDTVPPAQEEDPQGARTYLIVDDPKHWYVLLLNALFPDSIEQPPAPEGTDDGTGGRFPDVVFGRGCIIHPDVEIGPGSVVANNVTLYRGTRVGANCHIMDGCVIGGAGISFTKQADGPWATFPHLGRVIIGDRVRIGQNSVVQRGLLRNTVLSDDVKTGALTNIAHNCLIGERTWISAGVVFCGSVRTGEDVFIGAGATLNNHIRLGDRCKVASAAFVVRDVAADANVLGSPAKPVPFLSRF